MTYLEKLVHSAATIVAEASGAQVTEDQYILAVLFMRNHLTSALKLREEPTK